MISTPLPILIGVGLYFGIGIAAFGIADRHDFEGDNWRLIYRWPGAAAVAVVALALVWSEIWDETRGEP